MPLINLEYDNNNVTDSEAQTLSEAIQLIVSEATGIEDVFVYTNTAKIKVGVAPIEIFIRMKSSLISDQDALVSKIKDKLQIWKTQTSFTQPINLTLIPMDWKVEIGI